MRYRDDFKIGAIMKDTPKSVLHAAADILDGVGPNS